MATNRYGKWIPVSERLPETHTMQDRFYGAEYELSDPVLGCGKREYPDSEDPGVAVVWYEDDGDGKPAWITCPDCSQQVDVIAWMPLPEPYKGGECDRCIARHENTKEEGTDADKIRAIVKRPDEEIGHVTNISATLKNLQNIVGGYIETVTIRPGVVVICNEEGRIAGLDPNCAVKVESLLGCGTVDFVGEIIVVGADGDEFCDLPEWVTRKEWKTWLV